MEVIRGFDMILARDAGSPCDGVFEPLFAPSTCLVKYKRRMRLCD
jgi:hypothetical protein